MDFMPASKRAALRFLLPVAVLCLHGAALAQTAASPAGAPSNARIASLLESLGKVRTPTSAAISPDGNYVAWAVRGEHGSELHLTGIAEDGAWDRVIAPDTIADVTSGKPGACTASHPAWSPDGKQLAFLSDCSGEPLQPAKQDNIFVWTPTTNAMKQVSHLHGPINSLEWSPDGKAIAFLFVENATRSAGALDAMKPWSGVIGEDGVEVQRVAYITLGSWDQSDAFDHCPSGEGPLPERCVTKLLSGFNFYTPSTLHVYEFSWSPDGTKLAFVAAPPPGENSWWVAKLYIQFAYAPAPEPGLNMAGTRPCDMCEVLDPSTVSGPLHGLQIAVPRFSPDGKQIAFIGGLMSDQGSTGGDIYVIPATGVQRGGEPKEVTPERPASPAYIAWLDDHDIGISEHLGGSSHITALDLTTGEDVPGLDLTLPETIVAGSEAMSVSVASHSFNVALIRQSFDHGPEVWAGPTDNLKQLTHLNDTLKPAWGKAESIEWMNEGFHIQGWLLYPAGWSATGGDPAKKYPLLVSVHGGPSSAVTPRWPGAAYGETPFSALGYFVFMPNPRGSFGQGEKFTQANVKDFGYGDLRDILAGMDVLEKRFPIDKQREGLTGWSYGGFMTMFAVTQTTRFKAAVAGAGIADWESYYGENSIDHWMVPFFGATVYDDPAVYAKSSAIGFIKNVKSPTLVVVGDRDGECPAPQSFEFWHALKAEGVKTQLVVYPNEGHHFVDPEHQRDVLKRALDWLEIEMPAK
jgi:dipeptidyl aminopeptidase/acylaminoacyl peptidase